MIVSSLWFQSTHPRGVRRGVFFVVSVSINSFNPRTRVGCDFPRAVSSTRDIVVSIHAPAWGATLGYGGKMGFQQSFNPRTRVGCDVMVAVSPLMMVVFQSTHPRGVRRKSRQLWSSVQVFQSTHPRGVRPVHAVHAAPHGPVSIHAPAWGATTLLETAVCGALMFQSTHPRGVRRATRRSRWCWRASFNPRTRVGCDASSPGGGARNLTFQSTHPRGVRPDGPALGVRHQAVSIHAPAWGATVSMFYPVDSRD